MSIQKLLNSDGKIGSQYLPLSTSSSPITVPINAVTNGTSASAGQVGQLVRSQVLLASPINILSQQVAQTITSINLTEGLWFISANAYFSSPSGITQFIAVEGVLSTPNTPLNARMLWRPFINFLSVGASLPSSVVAVPFGEIYTITLSGVASWTGGVPYMCGYLQAVRVA
jgi:hypothetical protein